MVAKFVNSRHGARALILNGHKFVKDRQTNGTINWRCSYFIRFKCKSRAITKVIDGSEKVKITNGLHSHQFRHTDDPCVLRRNPLGL